MVASSVSGASSVRSRASTAGATPAKMAPHMLGGSKNLMSERFRREQAEQTLLKTRQSLKAVTTELVPQVDELARAVKMMQVEKRHQLTLDETSQEVLESLQQQIHDIEARDADFSRALDERMERLLAQVKEEFQAEKYELQAFVAQVQDAQDSLLAEVRLVQHELVATKQFLSQQVENMDDAIDSLRKELARVKDQHTASSQSTHARIMEMDEKLFALDKELLKLKLILPSSMSAQIAPKFADGIQPSDTAKAVVLMESSRSSMVVTQKLSELASNLETVKVELAAYRNADRQQFDAMTTRLRESSKSHQSLKREIDVRFQEIQIAYDSMITKVPSELSRRFLKAQSQWEDELRSIRVRVDELGSRPSGSAPANSVDSTELYDAKAVRSLDAAIHREIERLNDLSSTVATLKSDVDTICHAQETTVEALRAAVARLETDVLGLYDWTKHSVADLQRDVTFTTGVLQYFQQHAKILPKEGR